MPTPHPCQQVRALVDKVCPKSNALKSLRTGGCMKSEPLFESVLVMTCPWCGSSPPQPPSQPEWPGYESFHPPVSGCRIAIPPLCSLIPVLTFWLPSAPRFGGVKYHALIQPCFLSSCPPLSPWMLHIYCSSQPPVGWS